MDVLHCMKRVQILNQRLHIKLIAILLLACCIGSYLYYAARGVSAAWFDDGWRYRVAVPISAHTAAENNVYLALTGTNGIDTTDTTKFQTDCGDIRFTDAGGNILPYYLTTACGLAQTGFHVFFSSFPAGAQTIYYYYGNPTASNGFASADFATAATGVTLGTRGSETNSPVSPIAFWRFDEGYGQTINNSMGAVNTGTLGPDASATSTDPSWASDDMCISGKCLQFVSASSQYVNFGSSIPAAKSIGFWVRPSTTTTSLAVLNGAAGNASISVSSGTVSTGAGFSSPTIYVNGIVSSTLTANTWQYVVVTTGTGITASNIMLGRVNTSYLNGFMDEVKIYGVALSLAQVKANYAAGLAKQSEIKGASVSFGSSRSSTNTLSNGLVGYWKMDESSWTNDCSTLSVIDYSGNANLRSCPSTTGPTGGNLGKFYRGGTFDGSDDYLESTDSIFNLSNNITLSAWVNISSTPANDVYVVDRTNNNSGYSLGWNSNRYIRLRIGNGSSTITTTGATALALNTWYHITGTVDSSGLARVYLNGALDGTGAISLLTTSSGQNLRIGYRAAVNAITGSVDEVRVYNRALSGAEVFQLYNFAPGPVGYWKLDENSGLTANDSSGNNNVGTLTNNPTWTTGKFGSSIYFDPSSINKYVDISQSSSINDLPAFTYSLWIKPTQLQSNTIFQKGSGVSLYLENVSSGLRTQIYLNCSTTALQRYTTSTDNLSLNTWHHIEFIWDGGGCALSNIQLYLDGRPATQHVNSTDGSGTKNSDSTKNIYIGNNYNSTDQIQGWVDDFKLYNYVRTPAQILEDMNSGHTVNSSPMVYWKLDEGYNTTANNIGTLASSTTPANGTLSGAVWKQDGKIGKAVHMPVNTNYVSAGTASFLDRLNAMSVSLWINPQSLAVNKGIISRSNFSSQNSFAVVTDAASSQEIRVYMASSLTDTANYFTTSGLGLTNGIWTHLIISYDASEQASSRIKVYKDGKLVSGSVTGTIPAGGMTDQATSLLKLGATDSGSYTALNAIYDEVKIYSAPFSSDQVKTEINQGKSAVLGATSTSDDGRTASNSASREFCVPGDTGQCSPPIGYWKMDENTGLSSINDSSGNNYQGTMVGGFQQGDWTTGKNGSSLNFDGVDDQIDVSNFSYPTGDFTYEAWINPDSFGVSNTIFSGATATTGGNELNIDTDVDGDIDVTTHGVLVLNGTNGTVQVGKWTHIAVTRSGSTIKSYINGKADTVTGTDGVAFAFANCPFSIGVDRDSTVCSNLDSWFDGRIDDVKVFNYARSPAQIAWDYNKGAPSMWYKFDECQGLVNYNAAINAAGQAVGLNAAMTLSGNSAGTCTSTTTTDSWYLGANGKFNSALGLDGNDYLSVATPNLPTGDFSYAAWIYLNNLNNDATLVKTSDGAGANEIKLSVVSDQDGSHPNNLRMVLHGSSNYSTQKIYAGTWVHITATRVGSSVTAYINGQLVISGSNSTVLNFSSCPLYIGVSPGSGCSASFSEYLNGKIDDLRIYNYALTQTQIKNIMNENNAVRIGPLTGSP
jgi:hypothetical protein